MARTAAGCDAGRHRDHAALGTAVAHERVEVGRFRGFKRRDPALGSGREVTQTVENHQGELGVCFQRQFRVELVQVHAPISNLISKTITVCCRGNRRRAGQRRRILLASKSDRQWELNGWRQLADLTSNASGR